MMLERLRTAGLVAASLCLCTPSARGSGQENPWILQPRTYASASGEYSVRIEPGERRGRGPGTYTLFRNESEVWRKTLDPTLRRAFVSDRGFVFGYALSKGLGHAGDLVVMSIDPGGEVVGRVEYPQRSDGKMHGGPEPYVVGLAMLSYDRMLLRTRMSEGPEEWWVFRTAPALTRIETHDIGEVLGARRLVIIEMEVVRGTDLVAVEWYDISNESGNVRLSVFDPGRAREVWRTERVPRGELESRLPWHFRLVHECLEDVWLVELDGTAVPELMDSPIPIAPETPEDVIPDLDIPASRSVRLGTHPVLLGGCVMKGGLLLAQNCTDRKMMAFNRDGSVAYEWVPKDQTLRNMLRVPVPCTVDDDQCVRLWVRWDRSLRFAPDGECEMTSWIERHVMVLPDGGSTWGIRLGQVDLVRAGATTEILKRPDGTWFDGIQAAAIGADGAIAVAEEVDGCIVSVYSASGSPVAMHRFPSGSSYGYVVPGSGWVAVGGFRGWFVVRHSDGVVRRLHHGPASAAATESGDGLIVVDSNLVLTEYRITG